MKANKGRAKRLESKIRPADLQVVWSHDGVNWYDDDPTIRPDAQPVDLAALEDKPGLLVKVQYSPLLS